MFAILRNILFCTRDSFGNEITMSIEITKNRTILTLFEVVILRGNQNMFGICNDDKKRCNRKNYSKLSADYFS